MQQHDPPLGPVALDLLIRSRVIELRNDADGLAGLCEPPKAFPLPPGRRLTLRLVQALRAERARSRRLLELLAE
jgi:hypothetical protein